MTISILKNDKFSSGGAVPPQDNYEYQPLEGKDEIRVLVFDTTRRDKKLRFTLEHQSLLEMIEFDALSYRWGDDTKTKRITCDGASMRVTENLHAALKELARVSKKSDSYMNPMGRLWVDAICINQDDVEEKNKQIPLMGEIYSTARQTIAWIGDGDDESGVAWNEKYIEGVLKSQWFQRLWIVQEAVLAKELVVAARRGSAPWHDFMSHVLHLSAVYSSGEVAKSVPNYDNIVAINVIQERHQRERQSPYWILELMEKTKSFQATNKKDCVYALYGLVEKISFPVNYSSEYTYAEMTADFAKWAMEEIPGLAFLSYSRGNNPCRCGESCPSWMPCPGIKTKKYRLLYNTPFKTLNSQHKVVVQFEGNQRLRLKCAIIDIIDTNDHYPMPGNFEEKLRALSKIAETIRHQDPSDHKYKRFCAAAALVTIGQEGARAKIDFAKRVFYRESPPADIKTRTALRPLLLLTHSHSLYITKTKRFAWVPSSKMGPPNMGLDGVYTEPGDKICLFQGGRIPYVLRPQGDDEYTLVGECWVEGLMNDEGLKMSEYKFDIITLV